MKVKISAKKKLKMNQTLTVTRDKKSSYNCVTTLKDNKGKVKAILTGYNQPIKKKPFIVLKGQMYKLKFIN